MALENKVPEWLAEGTEPPKALKESGFTAGYKPPAAYFNWFWSGVSKALKELQEHVLGSDERVDEHAKHVADKANPHDVTVEQIGAVSNTLLWANASHSGTFPNQMIPVPLGYDGYKITYLTKSGDIAKIKQASFIVPFDSAYKTLPYEMSSYIATENVIAVRTFNAVIYPYDSSQFCLDFSSGRYYIVSNGANIGDNNYIIPLEIYGIKGAKLV